MATTMSDVARLAGVSIKTVSNVVNDHPHVRPTTRARVQDAIDKLGYEVNIAARSLRRGRSGLVMLAVPELRVPYFAELADSVIGEAERRGLGVLVEQTNADRARELDIIQGVRGTIVDGVLFSPLALGTEDLPLFQLSLPLVLLGERIFASPFDHVTMDNVAAARAATEHLLRRGRRRVLLLGVHPGEVVGSAALREQGYREALQAAGIPVDADLLAPAGLWHRDTGAQAVREAMARGVEFDAVFALNDALAFGAMHELQRAGVGVPQDVAVMGFDDVEEASYSHPTLSSVHPGREQIAREAVRLLDQRLREADTKPAPGVPVPGRAAPERIFSDYEVIERESTAG